uniref:Kinesin-like protein n=1 Tax=Corethron hystrix TaxID=216773 RepID=A0A7S1BTT2_9STRA|mmetsp:Transcript_39677/g.92874  ORF Transcript_39677/g.92874 Transcript_39677/m.92874 type:complete len:652 (+) Transcript_39677:237-2192(+)
MRMSTGGRSPARKSPSLFSSGPGKTKDGTRRAIERMEAEREARRIAMANRKIERAEEEQRNIAAGNPGDVDFIGQVRSWRQDNAPVSRERETFRGKICICVRKRPVSDKERAKKDHDSVTVRNPTVYVHSAKLKVDGITKYLDHNGFAFDHSFDEAGSTEDVYRYTTFPLVEFVVEGRGGRATCFAYGQTGSGKTHTMSGIQTMVAEDIFAMLHLHEEDDDDGRNAQCRRSETTVTVSFYELYGGRCQDLLNERRMLKILEDGKGEVVVTGLEEFEAENPEELMCLVEKGNRLRTTHATEANDTSSRSHAVCQIALRDKNNGRLKGKLSLVDLAGSERGSDTKSHNRQRRTESAEINKSLLALKECIRALDNGGGQSHVPYRSSKLTLVLKDCFTSPLARTTMVATVSPGASSCDHTINTLRYADRVKEKKVLENSSVHGFRFEKNREKFLESCNDFRDFPNGFYHAKNFNNHTISPGKRTKSKQARSVSPFAQSRSESARVSPPTAHIKQHRSNTTCPFRARMSPYKSPRKNPAVSSESNIAISDAAPSSNITVRNSPMQSPARLNLNADASKSFERPKSAKKRSIPLYEEGPSSTEEECTGEEHEVEGDNMDDGFSLDNYFEEEEGLLNLHMNIIQVRKITDTLCQQSL